MEFPTSVGEIVSIGLLALFTDLAALQSHKPDRSLTDIIESMPAVLLPRFTAVANGFPFPNSWEPGTPVIELLTPFGTLKLGDASGGVCGGMVYAAADFYVFDRPVPQERSPSLFKYLCRRLLDSWSLPFGVVKYYNWQRRPGNTRTWLGTRLQSGVTRLTVEEEWPKIRAAIDSGVPAPLGLVKVHSWRFQDMAHNHQVLCHGYTDDGSNATLHVYDPNWPSRAVTLQFDISAPDEERIIEHSEEGASVRGAFLTDYARPQILDWDESDA